ncbi:TBC domain-containing protein kinase-like protein [Ostrea edulis]|uniref:TBC domain-containing protein kinase-like protein n=1 Tax=Ostrea edulis TaxID=37623 RepID=UPI0024AFCE9F|nr:TBC domain-containing protein kinase-like protein [Ostrea edulis]
MNELGDADFGLTTFFARTHPNDKCGANGLPLTPNSIKILGRFEHLKTINHENVCKYIDIQRGKHERLMVVTEHYQQNLKKVAKSGKYSDEDNLVSLAYGIVRGLAYLNNKGITHRNLSQENILFNTKGKVKLSEYGLYHMTDYGADIAFPIGHPQYLSPEVLCELPIQYDEHSESEPTVLIPSGPKSDVWSLGLILLEVLTGEEFWGDLTIPQAFFKILSFVNSDIHPLDTICKDLNVEGHVKSLSRDFIDFLRHCLAASPKDRLNPSELVKHSLFRDLRQNDVMKQNEHRLFSSDLRSLDLELPVLGQNGYSKDLNEDHLSQRSMEEIYYLWRLAGGELFGALKKEGLVKTKPPIHLLPYFSTMDGEVFGQRRDQAEFLDRTIIILSQEQLRKRLSEIDETAYYPLLEDENGHVSTSLPSSPSNSDLSETASLPLVIKEKDIEYQFHRIILYERLIKGYPYKKNHIWKEARVDIPPLVRANVWAALLEVEGDIYSRYDSIDKETPTTTDRQIEVDIPRCHQYHELLSSPIAHAKFKRILKAWVVSHPQYVYWQGLDSLSAPFLALNFNNEALAYTCLSAFIPKYLHNFFLKDNSQVIQEYLAVFSHLITFHDPELSNHLDGIGFIPDLYAIPWFLTMFAHAFPLHKLVHLWDTLLLGNSSFPLCIGVAILQQFRDRLLSYGFNECILMFSDMPEIDIQTCVQDSIRIFCNTPKSATFRQYARELKKSRDSRPNVSYYSRDYNEQPKSELSMEPIKVEELKTEKCCRISAEDLIELGELCGPASSKSPTKRRPNSKPVIIVIDIRNPEDYAKGTIPGSINIPFPSAFSPEGDLNPCPAVNTLNQNKGQVKVIVGSRGKNSSNFAADLVRLGYQKVCVLHKGIDVLRSTSILTVPPADYF